MARSMNGQHEKAVDAKLAKLKPEFRLCRSSRHAYDDFQPFAYTHTDGKKYIVALWACRRCPYERWDFYDTRYAFQFSRPRYPTGYLLKWGPTEDKVRITSRDATRSLLRTTFDGKIPAARPRAKARARR